jgi:putative ABC transport system permease protein
VKIESFLKRTDGEFWEILEFDFVGGGPFTAQDEKQANLVAVINEATRKKFFGEASAVGKTIDVDGQNFRVVGVVRDVPIFRLVPFADIWVPISTSKSNTFRQEIIGGFMAMILARDRSDFDDIKSEFQSRVTQAQAELLDQKVFNQLTGGADTLFEAVSKMFFSPNRFEQSHPGRLLAAIVLLMILFMLLPTINLININVSRIMERASEIGVRKAFGASSWTLVGQFVVENLLLTLVGGIIGFVGSLLVLRLLTDSGLIPYAEFHTNIRIFLYGLLIAIFFGLFSGIYPAWKMSRLHPVEALRGRTR